MLKTEIKFEAHYPCGITLNVNNRYKLQEQKDECGAIEYQIVDTEDLEIVETHIDKDEANAALKYYNN